MLCRLHILCGLGSVDGVHWRPQGADQQIQAAAAVARGEFVRLQLHVMQIWAELPGHRHSLPEVLRGPQAASTRLSNAQQDPLHMLQWVGLSSEGALKSAAAIANMQSTSGAQWTLLNAPCVRDTLDADCVMTGQCSCL